MKLSKKWLQMAEMYKRFGYDSCYDYSDQAAIDMFNYESNGIALPESSCYNGYATTASLELAHSGAPSNDA